MAVRHQLIKRPPAVVWSVLEDGSRYADWVVGTSDSRPVDGNWPEVGAKIEYDVRLGPWTVSGHTVVRRHEPPEWLELEICSGPLGTARIAIDIRPWGPDTLVIVDEHPLQGPGGLLHNAAVDALLQARHRSMLGRLAEVVEKAPSRHRADTPAT
ncbi:SRPBCC family protein [Streptomyces sp. A3M-1-3]|uniref:SRPBCC family protein n=1 Tax=Streptomyces sp. A3M-1-3 TaxID=2962044 RepID=UPI0020B7C7C5|nr:SRPBCC family protein [Streptomyces sp. A3M-1-3]MCP3819715.1 SRPBCC family protein [Streptomyces sp. A3M-1-3]